MLHHFRGAGTFNYIIILIAYLFLFIHLFFIKPNSFKVIGLAFV